MMKENDSPGSNTANKATNGQHLACRECQRKKIKCDRTYPSCGQCEKAGLPCHASTRKPRAKIGTRAVDAELRIRIAKLEKLVESFADEDGKLLNPESGRTASTQEQVPFTGPSPLFTPTRLTEAASPGSPRDATSPDTSRYVAGNFWSSLTQEVKALADAFEEDVRSDEDGYTPETMPPSGVGVVDPINGSEQQYELIFCPPGALYVIPGAATEPLPAIGQQLLSAYIQHVDPQAKLFHVPTLTALIKDRESYLGRAPDALCNRALRASIYFAAANAITDEESETYFGKAQTQLVSEYRKLVDIALYQCDPLNTTEIATLQALVVYTSAIRILDPSRRAWSMVGLLVRIARAMSIHRELPGESIYLAELRRRLWYNIVFLDSYASIDRGSESAIHPDTFTRVLPSDVNDADFGPGSAALVPRTNQITDMSLALLAMEASAVTLRMTFIEETSSGEGWQQRLEIAYAFQKKVVDQYLRHCNPARPAHRMIAEVSAAACHSLILRAVRPMQHHPQSVPPRVDSPWVMNLALNILRHSDQLWASMSGRWRKMPWVPWQAIAVALAGLCSIRGNALANEAWPLVHRCMARYAPNVADTKDGMLWKPLEKLRIKAEAFRDGLDSQSAAAPLPLPTAQTKFSNTVPVNKSIAAPQVPMNMFPDLLDTAALDSMFDFPPDMQASLPNDTSWLDWEAVLQDMDEIRAEDVQWT